MYEFDRKLAYSLQDMKVAVEQADWLKMKQVAYSLKRSTSSIGAGRLQLICVNIIIRFLRNELSKMIDWY